MNPSPGIDKPLERILQIEDSLELHLVAGRCVDIALDTNINSPPGFQVHFESQSFRAQNDMSPFRLTVAAAPQSLRRAEATVRWKGRPTSADPELKT